MAERGAAFAAPAEAFPCVPAAPEPATRLPDGGAEGFFSVFEAGFSFPSEVFSSACCFAYASCILAVAAARSGLFSRRSTISLGSPEETVPESNGAGNASVKTSVQTRKKRILPYKPDFIATPPQGNKKGHEATPSWRKKDLNLHRFA